MTWHDLREPSAFGLSIHFARIRLILYLLVHGGGGGGIGSIGGGAGVGTVAGVVKTLCFFTCFLLLLVENGRPIRKVGEFTLQGVSGRRC